MISDPKKCAIILLAAGSSSRLGEPKQLLPWQDKTLLEHAIAAAVHAHVGPVMVVLGAHNEKIKPFLASSDYVINTHWQDGMAGSIRCGLEAVIEKYAGIHGAILSVCDQPFLLAAIFQQLLEKHTSSGKPIVASAYDDATLGTPVFFHNSLFAELLKLTGDKGAKALIKKFDHHVATVLFPGGAMDIDTLADYHHLKGQE